MGKLLITDAGEIAAPAKVFVVNWDVSTDSFIVTKMDYYTHTGTAGALEHATFAPLSLPYSTP